MSAMHQNAQNAMVRGKPPDKGSFPLDHDGECLPLKKNYMKCLRRNDGDNLSCRYVAKEYLQCLRQWQSVLLFIPCYPRVLYP